MELYSRYLFFLARFIHVVVFCCCCCIFLWLHCILFLYTIIDGDLDWFPCLLLRILLLWTWLLLNTFVYLWIYTEDWVGSSRYSQIVIQSGCTNLHSALLYSMPLCCLALGPDSMQRMNVEVVLGRVFDMMHTKNLSLCSDQEDKFWSQVSLVWLLLRSSIYLLPTWPWANHPMSLNLRSFIYKMV